jgi:hypothetical protein
MKKIIILFWILIIPIFNSKPNVFALNVLKVSNLSIKKTINTEGWCNYNFKYLNSHRTDFINKPIENLYNTMTNLNMTINRIVLEGTSPWATDYDGHIYISTIVLFSKDTDKLKKGGNYSIIRVNLNDKNIDLSKFLKSVNNSDYITDMKNKSKKMKILNFSIQNTNKHF